MSKLLDVQKIEALDRTLSDAQSDYARYVNTVPLFACQKPASERVNEDELAFQIVHQVEELWMKLLASALLTIEAALQNTTSVTSILRHFQRTGCLLTMMRDQLDVLMTLSPQSYRQIREGLGQGSGQDSPGYRAVLACAGDLWPAFVEHWLDDGRRSIESIYDNTEDPAFAVAEALVTLDVGLTEFRHAHLQLVDRTIGLMSNSLKGRPAQDLVQRVNERNFDALWQARMRFGDAVRSTDRRVS